MARQITTSITAPLRSQSPRGLRLVLTRALARERHAELAPLADDVRIDRKAGWFRDMILSENRPPLFGIMLSSSCFDRCATFCARDCANAPMRSRD